MPSKKPRIRPYIDHDIYLLLRTAAERSGATESGIVNTALAEYFRGEHKDGRTNALLRRLDQITRQVETAQRDQLVHSEAFGLFIRYFLTVIPPVAAKDKAAAQADGQRRFETYLDSLREILTDGDPILRRALEDARVDDSVFFTEEELSRLHEPRLEGEVTHA